jgi:hypothetical protein
VADSQHVFGDAVCEIYVQERPADSYGETGWSALAFVYQPEGLLRPVMDRDGEPVERVQRTESGARVAMIDYLVSRFGPLRRKKA